MKIIKTIIQKIQQLLRGIILLIKIVIMPLIYTAIIVMATIIIYESNIQREIKDYTHEEIVLNYYNSVETLLDSLYIDEDAPILETDEGAQYLEDKWKLDSLIYNK